MAPAPSSEEAEEPAPAPPAATAPAPGPVAKAAKVVKKAARQPVKKAAARKAAPAQATTPTTAAPVKARVRKRRPLPWVEPFGSDTPTSHPVKAKLSSMLYHLPGMAFYDRTRPDRCYVDAEAAEADGFIRAKR